jgi:predicted nucleic acid binding AN1-type Zn finger protein
MSSVLCPCCGSESTIIYRCEYCGRDLTDQRQTHGRVR